MSTDQYHKPECKRDCHRKWRSNGHSEYNTFFEWCFIICCVSLYPLCNDPTTFVIIVMEITYTKCLCVVPNYAVLVLVSHFNQLKSSVMKMQRKLPSGLWPCRNCGGWAKDASLSPLFVYNGLLKISPSAPDGQPDWDLLSLIVLKDFIYNQPRFGVQHQLDRWLNRFFNNGAKGGRFQLQWCWEGTFCTLVRTQVRSEEVKHFQVPTTKSLQIELPLRRSNTFDQN